MMETSKKVFGALALSGLQKEMKRHVLTTVFATLALAMSVFVALPTTAYAADSGSNVNMYRLYNRISAEHLYTRDAHEVNVLTRGDWNYEGTGWIAPGKSNIPVYRLYNPILGDHHYTLDANEVKVLTTKHHWKNEGIAWYSSENTKSRVPVYRQYNPKLTVGSHNYTTDKNEYDVNNARNGWRGEGIAWYGVAKGSNKTPKPADPKAGSSTGSNSGNTGNSGTIGTGNSTPSKQGEIADPIQLTQCMPAEEALIGVDGVFNSTAWGVSFTHDSLTKTITARIKDSRYTMPSGAQTKWSCIYNPQVYKASPKGVEKYNNYTQVGVRYYNATDTINPTLLSNQLTNLRQSKGLAPFKASGSYITKGLAVQRAIDYVAGGGTPDVPLSLYNADGLSPIGEAFYTSSVFDKSNTVWGGCTMNPTMYGNCGPDVRYAYNAAIDYWTSHPDSDGYKLLMNSKVDYLTMGIIYLPDTTAAQQMAWGGGDVDPYLGVYGWGANQFVVTIIGNKACSSSADTSSQCKTNQNWLDPWRLLISSDKDGVAYSWANPNQTKLTSTTLFGQPAYKINTTGTKVFQAKGVIWNKAVTDSIYNKY